MLSGFELYPRWVPLISKIQPLSQTPGLLNELLYAEAPQAMCLLSRDNETAMNKIVLFSISSGVVQPRFV